MKRLLLDTHVLLWLLADDPKLGPHARALIVAADEVDVSAASMWEIEIKRALGKLVVPDDLHRVVREEGLRELPVDWTAAAGLAQVSLPHRNPFDAMLLAQARTERLTLLTADEKLLAAAPHDTVDARV